MHAIFYQSEMQSFAQAVFLQQTTPYPFQLEVNRNYVCNYLKK